MGWSTPGVLALLLAGACGGEEKPPSRTAAAVRGAPAPTGGSSRSMGDSALGPAAREAADNGDWEKAESLYSEQSRRQPRNAEAKRDWGVALTHLERYGDAEKALQASLELADTGETRVALAAAFAGEDRWPSALPHLRKAVRLSPAEPSAWTMLAKCLVKVDKPDGAADALAESKKACRACAKDDDWNQASDEVARAFCAKAEASLSSGDKAGARKAIDAAADLRPELPETHLGLAKVAAAEGDAGRAKTEYRKAVDGFSDAKVEGGASARLALATLLVSDGNAPEAIKLATEVVDARGDDPEALTTLGKACDAARDDDCARRAWGTLVKLPSGKISSETLETAKKRMKQLKHGKKGKTGKSGKPGKRRH